MIDQKIVSSEKNIRTVAQEVALENETGQSLSVLLDDNTSKIRIRVIYAPQENQTMTSNNELKIMHNNISKQISIAQDES